MQPEERLENVLATLSALIEVQPPKKGKFIGHFTEDLKKDPCDLLRFQVSAIAYDMLERKNKLRFAEWAEGRGALEKSYCAFATWVGKDYVAEAYHYREHPGCTTRESNKTEDEYNMKLLKVAKNIFEAQAKVDIDSSAIEDFAKRFGIDITVLDNFEAAPIMSLTTLTGSSYVGQMLYLLYQEHELPGFINKDPGEAMTFVRESFKKYFTA